MVLAGRYLSREWKSRPRRGGKKPPTPTTKARTRWIWQTPAIQSNVVERGESGLWRSPAAAVPFPSGSSSRPGGCRTASGLALPSARGPAGKGRPVPVSTPARRWAAARRPPRGTRTHLCPATRPASRLLPVGSPAVSPRDLFMTPSTPSGTGGDVFWLFVLLCSAGARRGFCRQWVRREVRGRQRRGERAPTGSRRAHLKRVLCPLALAGVSV